MSPCQLRSATKRSEPIRLACKRRAATLVIRQSDSGQRAAVGFTADPFMRAIASSAANALCG